MNIPATHPTTFRPSPVFYLLAPNLAAANNHLERPGWNEQGTVICGGNLHEPLAATGTNLIDVNFAKDTGGNEPTCTRLTCSGKAKNPQRLSHDGDEYEMLRATDVGALC